MIIGTGIDIIEISRIAAAINHQSFLNKVFTVGEQKYCDLRGKGRAASYAARFAAKEAVFKSFGTGLSKGSWQEVEIMVDEKGRPEVMLTGYFKEMAKDKKVQKIHVSLTHSQEYAAAQVILWGGFLYEDSIS